jgi:hypothetical protein
MVNSAVIIKTMGCDTLYYMVEVGIRLGVTPPFTLMMMAAMYAEITSA